MPVLVVEGVIASTVGVPVDVPRIRLRAAQRFRRRGLFLDRAAVATGAGTGRGPAIPQPACISPADGQDLQVRFFTKRDASGSALRPGGSMARILIAEDEEPLRVLVSRALKEDGHEIVATADGAQALDTLQRAAPDGSTSSWPTSRCR